MLMNTNFVFINMYLTSGLRTTNHSDSICTSGVDKHYCRGLISDAGGAVLKWYWSICHVDLYLEGRQ